MLINLIGPLINKAQSNGAVLRLAWKKDCASFGSCSKSGRSSGLAGLDDRVDPGGHLRYGELTVIRSFGIETANGAVTARLGDRREQQLTGCAVAHPFD